MGFYVQQNFPEKFEHGKPVFREATAADITDEMVGAVADVLEATEGQDLLVQARAALLAIL